MSKLLAIATVPFALLVYVPSCSIRAIQEGPDGVNHVDLIRGERFSTKLSLDGLQSVIGAPYLKLRDASNTTLIIPIGSIHLVQTEDDSSTRITTRDGHQYVVLGQARSVADAVNAAISPATLKTPAPGAGATTPTTGSQSETRTPTSKTDAVDGSASDQSPPNA